VTAQLRVLSLGAGVQSTTIALMMAKGEIEPVQHAIFADTQWEPAAVYKHLDWLCEPGRLPFPVHIVTAGSLRQNIRDRRNTSGGRYAAIPWHIVNPDGSQSIGRRQCSSEYKLEPIMRKIRDLLGVSRHGYIAKGAVDVVLGISRDEVHRCRESRQAYMNNVYPLVDRGLRRYDCLLWLKRNGYPEPPKSACIGCPYTDNARWRERRLIPAEWEDAVLADRELRSGHATAMRGAEYMHRSCVPLSEVDFDQDDRQMDLFGNECLGVCDV
jgi:hypothetical protein